MRGVVKATVALGRLGRWWGGQALPHGRIPVVQALVARPPHHRVLRSSVGGDVLACIGADTTTAKLVRGLQELVWDVVRHSRHGGIAADGNDGVRGRLVGGGGGRWDRV